MAGFLAETVEIDISTMTKELPPIGKLSEIDLVTEGILTISKALEILKKCNCDISRLPSGKTGAIFLANEILSADSILFLVGQQINEFYQNPLLSCGTSKLDIKILERVVGCRVWGVKVCKLNV